MRPVRAASTDDVDACARVLAAAFQPDPGIGDGVRGYGMLRPASA